MTSRVRPLPLRTAESIAKSTEVAASESVQREPIGLGQAAKHMGKLQ
jgi:hypothetical protein